MPVVDENIGPDGAVITIQVGVSNPRVLPQIHPVPFTIPVIEADLSRQSIRAILGRDILARCVLLYSGTTGKIQLTF